MSRGPRRIERAIEAIFDAELAELDEHFPTRRLMSDGMTDEETSEREGIARPPSFLKEVSPDDPLPPGYEWIPSGLGTHLGLHLAVLRRFTSDIHRFRRCLPLMEELMRSGVESEAALQRVWIRGDEHHWKHPDGHTITVAHVNGEARYTLWGPRAGEAPRQILASDTDFDALRRLHEAAA